MRQTWKHNGICLAQMTHTGICQPISKFCCQLEKHLFETEADDQALKLLQSYQSSKSMISVALYKYFFALQLLKMKVQRERTMK